MLEKGKQILRTIIMLNIIAVITSEGLNAQFRIEASHYRIDTAALTKAERFGEMNTPTIVNRLVRVYFHVFRNNDGTNAAATLTQVQSEFNQLMANYAPHNICFANMGVDFINNTALNTQENVDSPATYAGLSQYFIPGCINIFYHMVLIGAGGYAYAIPNTYFSVASGNIGALSISHEMGHCLGLFHTHETTFGMEFIDGTNCLILGDRVCDTPADPAAFGPNPCFTAFGCLYTGSCVDLHGQSNYSPPYNNIMSYWASNGCPRTEFTAGQYSRIDNYLSTDFSLLNTQSPSSLLYGPVTILSGTEIKSAIFGITTSGIVSLGGTVKASLQGQSIILSSGFLASPSSGSVLIRAATCNY